MLFYDTIIIGSGVSGMSAGILLSKSGRNVLVVEQDKKPGGLMQTFVRESNVFPTGIHKLGSLGQGEILRFYFEFLGVFDKFNLVAMDDSAYEQFVFKTHSFTAPGGYSSLLNALVKAFPKEEKAVIAYLSSMKTTVARFPLYNVGNNGDNLGKISPDSPNGMDFSISILSLLLDLGCSDGLIKVLTGNKPLYGMEPDECPAMIHFLVTDSFLTSSWKVDEAKTPFAQAFIKALSEAGGTLRCSARVEKIQSDSGKIKGVRLCTQEEIACKEIVFTGHPQLLMDICSENQFRPAFRNRIKRAENTVGIFGVAAKWMDDDCPFALQDFYFYPWNSSLDSVYVSALPVKQQGGYSMTALTAMTEMETRHLMKLKQESYKKYFQAKEKMADDMVGVITDKINSARDKIKVVSTYTPLTFNRYTLSPLGTAYGVKKSAKTFWKNQLNPVTKIKGLFLAGQSLTVSGVTGAVISSVKACTAMEGMDALLKGINQ